MAQSALRKAFSAAVRPARPSDFEAILSVEENSFREESYPPELLQYYLAKSLKSPQTLMMVAVADDAGTAGYVLADEDGKGQGTIVSLAVSDAYRGRGLGRQLLEEVSESLRAIGAGKIVLQAEINNAPAIHLYETSGFVKTALLPGYYNGVNGIEMTKKIKKPKVRGIGR